MIVQGDIFRQVSHLCAHRIRVAGRIGAGNLQGAAGTIEKAQDGVERRRFAGAVAAKQRIDLARGQIERQAIEHPPLPAGHHQIADGQRHVAPARHQ